MSSRKTIYITLCLAIILFEAGSASEVLAQLPGGDGGGGDGNPGWWNGTDTEPFAGGVIRDAYCDIISLMEENLGGLFMAAAGILAFGAAAFGDLKHGLTAIATGISAFALSAMVSLYFGQLCGGGGGGGQNGRTAKSTQATFDAAVAVSEGSLVDYGNFHPEQNEPEATADDDFGF